MVMKTETTGSSFSLSVEFLRFNNLEVGDCCCVSDQCVSSLICIDFNNCCLHAFVSFVR